MTEGPISIQVKGLDKIRDKMKQFPHVVIKNFEQAGKESAEDVILPTEGLQNYPPETAANQPPAPYYIRGRGMQTASGNTGGSERLGTKWLVAAMGLDTKLGNPASYARWVHGDEQAGAMGAIGWKKLHDTAKKKLRQIQKVYQAWVDKTLREVGLK